jgi:hypothetical protein
MSSDLMAIENVRVEDRPWIDAVHEWITTIDHKRIGVLMSCMP